MIEELAAAVAAVPAPAFVGLSGAQGSGKSTIATALGARLDRCVVLSIDDFYLTRTERLALARDIHPLLATRGVPGTHDLALLTATVDTLLAGRDARLPVFDKTTDDRADSWREHRGPVDVVILEGWCVGARPQSPAALAEPISRLEREEDAAGDWRAWVNARLADDQPLFARLDLSIFLRAPSFEIVRAWRGEQEAKLARTPRSRPPMTDAELDRFIAHYERITRWMIADRPADVVVDLDAQRRALAISSGAR